ncbi:MAG: hypothetical protein EXS16_07855 [Gemmataceae bacterium]|nr:hypothetical protein [Gemmataceae bacterium]
MMRRFFQILLIILLVLLCIFDVRLYSEPGTEDAVEQLRFLRRTIDDGSAEKMQALFPEGYFFLHALYGSAWVEIGSQENVTPALRDEARLEVKWALEQLDSPTGTAPFPRDLELPHGVFHAGWTNWLRGGYLRLFPDAERPVEVLRCFGENSKTIADAFDTAGFPYLRSYKDKAWPVDSVVAIASLRLHDHLLPARFEATVARWRSQVQTRLDPETGLLPHRVDPQTGAILQGSRGSSQSLLLRFLLEIDPEMGREHYVVFRTRFVPGAWILPGTREYPIGTEGIGDIDSGPLVMGVSLSASVVSIAPARMVNDHNLALPYFQLGEAIGLPISWQGERRYVFGRLPIADAFLVYSRIATAWVTAPDSVTTEPIVPWGWRLGWHFLTILPIAGLLMLTRRRRGCSPDTGPSTPGTETLGK